MDEYRTRRMRIWMPEPAPSIDPEILAGVPAAPLSLEDVVGRRHVCFSPDELRYIVERAKMRILKVKTPDGAEEEVDVMDRVITARVDPAAWYFLRDLERRFGIRRSEAIRIGLFLLREILETQEG